MYDVWCMILPARYALSATAMLHSALACYPAQYWMPSTDLTVAVPALRQPDRHVRSHVSHRRRRCAPTLAGSTAIDGCVVAVCGCSAAVYGGSAAVYGVADVIGGAGRVGQRNGWAAQHVHDPGHPPP
eukprot:423355-Rhodomonas_salina.1